VGGWGEGHTPGGQRPDSSCPRAFGEGALYRNRGERGHRLGGSADGRQRVGEEGEMLHPELGKGGSVDQGLGGPGAARGVPGPLVRRTCGREEEPRATNQQAFIEKLYYCAIVRASQRCALKLTLKD